MNASQGHGLEVGQVYAPADGSENRLTVPDVATYANCDDVLVFDETLGIERRIDAGEAAVQPDAPDLTIKN